MVDVSEKAATHRRAVAMGFVRLSDAHLSALNALPKGDVFSVAQIAGILGAKRTSDLIPLCHPLPLSHVGVELRVVEGGLSIRSEARTYCQTGVEMEALTGVAIAALTVVDMVKAIGPDVCIEKIELVEKTGGKKDWKRD
jgi:cyclic pyranopterin phosphate synthase